MAKVVEAPVKLGKPSTIKTKRVRLPDGTSVRVRVLDADSPKFLSDLAGVFRANVTSVRRANTSLSQSSSKVASAWKAVRAAEAYTVSSRLKQGARAKSTKKARGKKAK
jgi:hypothetical protein